MSRHTDHAVGPQGGPWAPGGLGKATTAAPRLPSAPIAPPVDRAGRPHERLALQVRELHGFGPTLLPFARSRPFQAVWHGRITAIGLSERLGVHPEPLGAAAVTARRAQRRWCEAVVRGAAALLTPLAGLR